MLTVACVLSPGPTYDYSHVARLRNLVYDHIKQPYRFVCIDDSPFPGWWAKTSLFEPGRFSGRVLYLDLDVNIVGLLDDIADYPAPFAIIRDWNGPGYNSSVMAWDAGVADHIYSRFIGRRKIIMRQYRGDQDWIREQFLPATFPRGWCVSYKKHVRPTGQVPEGARVVVYHGKPKPWDLKC